ncbi:MAG TPA: hypothetical protein VGU22_01455 [Methylomirabilota bacterium]|jgi:hypothetical protein|nr:hypothetical protein [Methylomirabilota bacterium]
MATPRYARSLLLVIALVAVLGSVTPPTADAATLDARVLVLSADGREPSLAAIRQTLNYLGTPFVTWIATKRPGQLTPAQLSVGTRGYYQGVILTTGELGYRPAGGGFVSALTAAEWTALRDYERTFGVREVSWYTYPSTAAGFASYRVLDTSVTPVDVALTTAGRSVFPYVSVAHPLTIRQAYAYLARPLNAKTTPLLVDASGNTLGASVQTADARERLVLMFDNNQHLFHTLTLAYGLVNWVTKGLFLGERHVYLDAQVDDLFIASDSFGGGVYRMTGNDLRAAIAWQTRVQQDPVSRALRLHLAFNGSGTTGVANDTLTPVARANRGLFKWISHTYGHENLDAASYSTAWDELALNHQFAQTMRFTDAALKAYSIQSLVTPEISGLSNPAFLEAAWDFGVRYVVSDASRPGMSNPSPNAGIYNAYLPGILEIPRYPTGLFYNVSTPAQWVAEYNYLYGTKGIFPPPAGWGRNLTYAEILEAESDVLVRDLLRGDANPWMFHQSNLRAYDGTRTLLGDLLDLTLDKYRCYFTVPITSPTMDVLGQKFAARMAYNTAAVKATIEPGVAITITARRAAVVPVTGLVTATAELYAGQYISYVTLAAGQTVRLPLR